MRLLLVWLMVLAVPVQGMAGVAMQHCAQAAARTEQLPMTEASQDGHAHGSLQRQVPADPESIAAAQETEHAHGPAVVGPGTPALPS